MKETPTEDFEGGGSGDDHDAHGDDGGNGDNGDGDDGDGIPHFCHFFTQAKFLENKIYTEKTRKLRQNTQKIANFLRYYGKIHSKLPIFRVKSVKIYTGPKKFTRTCSWGS